MQNDTDEAFVMTQQDYSSCSEVFTVVVQGFLLSI